MSILGKRTTSWSRTEELDEAGEKKLAENEEKEGPIAAVVVVGVGGENRTGEEDEQRILLETGGGDEDEEEACKSSKKFDLLPQTMADMLCLQQELVSILFPLNFYLLPSSPFSHADQPPEFSILKIF